MLSEPREVAPRVSPLPNPLPERPIRYRVVVLISWLCYIQLTQPQT